MMSFEYIVSVVYFLAMLILLCAVVKRDLQMLQQNSYRNERLWRWIKTSSEYMSTLRILNFALFLIGISTLSESVYVVLIIVTQRSTVGMCVVVDKEVQETSCVY